MIFFYRILHLWSQQKRLKSTTVFLFTFLFIFNECIPRKWYSIATVMFFNIKTTLYSILHTKWLRKQCIQLQHSLIRSHIYFNIKHTNIFLQTFLKSLYNQISHIQQCHEIVTINGTSAIKVLVLTMNKKYYKYNTATYLISIQGNQGPSLRI